MSVKLGSHHRVESYTKESRKLIQWKIEGSRQRPHFVLLNLDGAKFPSAYSFVIEVKRESSKARQSPAHTCEPKAAEPFALDLHTSNEAQLYTFFGPIKKVQRENPPE